MTAVRPGDERILHDDHYICSFCCNPLRRGAVWIGPNISVCGPCIHSDNAADIIGRIFGDALFAVYEGKAYVAEVERITNRIESSIYRILYNHTRIVGGA